MSFPGQSEARANRTVYYVEGENDSCSIHIDGRLLLRLRHPGSFGSIRERADQMVQNLNSFFANPPSEAVTFFVEPVNGSVQGYCNGYHIFTVNQADAEVNDSGLIDLALLWLDQLQMEFYHLRDSHQHLVRETINGRASWYGYKFDGNSTACGEIYNPYAFTAAHRTYPPDTLVVVSNPRNGRQVVVRINDYGPLRATRDIDLSMAAARALGIKQYGVSSVILEVLK